MSLAFFLTVAATLLFWNLGQVALFEPDEGRYADIALTMLRTRDWLIPRMNHLVHLHKPPLSSWLVATSFRLLGPNEFSARLPNVLLSLAALLTTVSLGRLLFDFKTGLSSAWILLTAPLYLAVSRIVTPDMLLTFLNVFSMGCAASLCFGSRRPLLSFYGFMLALGLGMLTKGPVAWMMTILPTAAFMIWKKKRWEISGKHWVFGIATMLALSLGWYVWVAVEKSGTFTYFIQSQLLGRMFKGGVGHKHPLYYYLIVAPLGFLPWTLFLPSALARGVRTEDLDQRGRIQFLLLWFIIPFVLFSLFRSKLATYIVPLFPSLALLVGHFWREFGSGKIPLTRPLAVSSWFLASTYLMIPIAGLIFIKLRPEFIGGLGPRALVSGGVLMLGAWALMSTALLRKKFGAVFPLQIGIALAVGFLTLAVLPAIQYKNAKVFAQKITELRRPGDEILMYEHYFASLPFYLEERIVSVGLPPDPGTFDNDPLWTRYLISDEHAINDFAESPGRIFVLATEEGFETAKSSTRAPLYILFKQQGWILFSNRL